MYVQPVFVNARRVLKFYIIFTCLIKICRGEETKMSSGKTQTNKQQKTTKEVNNISPIILIPSEKQVHHPYPYLKI